MTSKIRIATRCAALGALVLFSVAQPVLADSSPAPAGTSSPTTKTGDATLPALPKPEVVELIRGEGSGLTAIFQKERIGMEELKRHGGAISRGGVKFAISGDDNALTMRAQAGELHYSAKEFQRINGVIPAGNEAGFYLRKETGAIGITTAPNNHDTLEVNLADGGKAAIEAGSSIRVESLANGCYVVMAKGRVIVSNGDGQRVIMTENSLPAHGGPLHEVKDRLGVQRMERVSPSVAVRIMRMNKQSLRLKAGSEEIELPATVARNLMLTNGTEMRVSQDPQSGEFTWRVVKGDVSMTIEGVLGWRAVATSGCGGAMTWDTKSMTVDFRNTGTEIMHISLPSRTVAVVEPGSTFQYSVAQGGVRNGPTTGKGDHGPSYSTAATGRARIYNSLNHRVYDVVSRNQLFIGGIPSKEQDDISTSRINIQTTWDNGLPFAFKMGAHTNGVMKPGDHKDVKYDDFHEVEFIYGQGGMLTVVAVEGSFHLIVQNANGMRLNVEEGNKVILTLDLKKKTFVVETGPENPSMIDLETDGGNSMAVEADAFINFNISDDGSVVGRSSDNGGGGLFLFNSPGGGQTPGSPGFGLPGGGNPSPGQDPSLLSQPLVTP